MLAGRLHGALVPRPVRACAPRHHMSVHHMWHVHVDAQPTAELAGGTSRITSPWVTEACSLSAKQPLL